MLKSQVAYKALLRILEIFGMLKHGQHHIHSTYYIVFFNVKSIITAKHILHMGKVKATGNFAKSLAQDAC